MWLREASHAAHSKINWQEFVKSKRDHVTIEHVYPQSPIRGEWPEFDRIASEQALRLCNSLGNLVPLAKAKNSSLCNKPFAEKVRSQDGTTGYFNGSYSENEIARVIDWGPQSIEDRGLRLLAFLERRWDVRFDDLESKRRLLQVL